MGVYRCRKTWQHCVFRVLSSLVIDPLAGDAMSGYVVGGRGGAQSGMSCAGRIRIGHSVEIHGSCCASSSSHCSGVPRPLLLLDLNVLCIYIVFAFGRAFPDVRVFRRRNKKEGFSSLRHPP